MAFVTNAELLDRAMAGGYAVGAFNTNNLEITLSIVEAAVEERSPLILAVSPGAMKYAGVAYLAAIARVASESADVPMSLHLDHGTSLEEVKAALDHGFSSVMIDGSKLSFEENVALTRQAVEMARAAGASTEAELGRLVGVEDQISVSEREASMTDPDQAAEFVERTGIDSLAVSIGNAHGWYKGEPKLDFERLRAIRARVSIPLVLHGASGIPDEMIREACAIGVDKINIDTEVRDAFRQAVARFVNENPEQIDPRKILAPAREAMREVVARKMRLFGCAGRA
ncbi:MAG: class II fructose-1,6-bisphosphate aldolase [Actinobacteria bacterium]|nr:class II fructose-1,6-bisphosphate aldolase [Actinomycetota bacterium]MDI6830855.1 class II fructose-1,6-bisphosphate aldolase [Actinomycetota bacterium]